MQAEYSPEPPPFPSVHTAPERLQAADTITRVLEHFRDEHYQIDECIRLPELIGKESHYLTIYDSESTSLTTKKAWFGYLRVLPVTDTLVLSYHDVVINEFDELLDYRQDFLLDDLLGRENFEFVSPEADDFYLSVADVIQTLRTHTDTINQVDADTIDHSDWYGAVQAGVLEPLLLSLSRLHKERVWPAHQDELPQAPENLLATEVWPQATLVSHVRELADKLGQNQDASERFINLETDTPYQDRLLRVNQPEGSAVAWIEQIDESLDEDNDLTLQYRSYIIDAANTLRRYESRFDNETIEQAFEQIRSLGMVYELLRFPPNRITDLMPGFVRDQWFIPASHDETLELVSALMRLREVNSSE